MLPHSLKPFRNYQFRILILFFTYFITTQNAVSQVVSYNLTVEKGLSNGSITSIIQDADGYIWLGTKHGLNRYDGSNITTYHYNNDDNSSINGNTITCLKVDSKRRLLVGTLEGGLSVLEYGAVKFKTFKHFKTKTNSISSDLVLSILEDHHGRVWVGTDKGVDLYNDKGNTFQHVTINNSTNGIAEHCSVKSLFEDSEGTIWMGTLGLGLFYLDPSSLQFQPFHPAKNKVILNFKSTITCIQALNKHELLLGTEGDGLLKINTKENSIANFLPTTIKFYSQIKLVRSILIHDGKILIGTDGQGLISIENYFTNKKIHLKQLSASSGNLLENSITVLTTDNQNNIWIGTSWHGASIIANPKSGIHELPAELFDSPDTRILTIASKGEEFYLLGTNGQGLQMYNVKTKTRKKFTTENTQGKIGNFINTIFNETQGSYWIGSFDKGLTRLDANFKPLVNYQHRDYDPYSISHNDVRAILKDTDGNLWIGTWGGGLNLLKKNSSQFVHYMHNPNDSSTLNSNNIVDMVWDKTGLLWITTFGGGLNVFNPKTKKCINLKSHENDKLFFPEKNLTCIYRDAFNHVWIGTWSKGLLKYNPQSGEVRWFTTSNGLPDNSITGIEEDQYHNLWISTKNGVCLFEITKNKLQRADQSYLFKSNSYYLNATYKDHAGNIYFTGTSRTLIIDPKHVIQNRIQPDVKVTRVKLFSNDISFKVIDSTDVAFKPSNALHLRYDENVLTIHFSTLQYPFNNSVFKVMMEGFDKNWQTIGSETSVTYTNLSPGNYTFRVTTDTSPEANGTYLNEDTLFIKVNSPWYKTVQAYAFYIVLFCFLLLFFHRSIVMLEKVKKELELEAVNSRHEKSISEVKQSFLSNISHEIRTITMLILSPLESMQESTEFVLKFDKQINTIKTNTNRLLRLTEELLNWEKLKSNELQLVSSTGNLVELVEEIYQSFSEQARAKELNYFFISDSSSILVKYDRNQLDKVFYNLLSNAFKFTNARDTITVRILDSTDSVSVLISDTGTGISPEHKSRIFDRFFHSPGNKNDLVQAGFGIGLFIAKEITLLHNGQIMVNSESGKGSEFIVQLPKVVDITNALQNTTEVTIETVSEEDADGDIEQLQSANELNPGKPKELILIVEDNEEIKNSLAIMLSPLYNICTAGDGDTGLTTALLQNPALILSDIMMPTMDGFTFCKTIKSDYRTSHIPVILLTGRSSSISTIEGYEIGADEYITKPFNKDFLISRINNLLKNRERLKKHYWIENIQQGKEMPSNTADEKLMNAVINYIENNLENEIRAETLAREIGLSHSMLYKRIKMITGENIMEFVRDYRLKKAAQLLDKGQYSLIDICSKVGYNDRRHFSNSFKNKFGKSPFQYSRSIKKNNDE